jgi:hypothetical protein
MRTVVGGTTRTSVRYRSLCSLVLALYTLLQATGCVSPTIRRQREWAKNFSYLELVKSDLNGTNFLMDCTGYTTWTIGTGVGQVSWLQKARCYTHDSAKPDSQRAAFRNAVAEEYITIVNKIYGDFEQSELLTRGYIDTAFDVAGLGLTAAAAVSSASNILGTAATGTLGWQHSINRNFYNAQTIVAINATMHALRLRQLALIRQREALTIDCSTTNNVLPQNGSQQACYTLEEAINDVQDLYQVGTVQRALVEINNQAAAQAIDAQNKLTASNTQAAITSNNSSQGKGITSVNPTSAQVQVGHTQAFNAVFIGVSAGAIQWQVNGVGGGNAATTGTVDSNGLYTAPSTMPAPPASPAVTVTAVSTVDKTSASASVTITP